VKFCFGLDATAEREMLADDLPDADSLKGSRAKLIVHRGFTNSHSWLVVLRIPAMITILAYFDPGSASLLVQAIAGGMAGLLVFGRVYALHVTVSGSQALDLMAVPR
jgi:hypothetical protein